ncbi:hypothetical protein MRB53_039143 [Persea americana]|nr:hypothetical protein MRB53_039143 [Persea americana]
MFVVPVLQLLLSSAVTATTPAPKTVVALPQNVDNAHPYAFFNLALIVQNKGMPLKYLANKGCLPTTPLTADGSLVYDPLIKASCKGGGANVFVRTGYSGSKKVDGANWRGVMYSWFFGSDVLSPGDTEFKIWQSAILWTDGEGLVAHGVSLADNTLNRGDNFGWKKIVFAVPIAMIDVKDSVFIGKTDNALVNYETPPSAADAATALKLPVISWEDLKDEQKTALTSNARSGEYASQTCAFCTEDEIKWNGIMDAALPDLE